MERIEVLVRLWDRGQEREAVVQVPASAFLTHCWKTIASLAAAVELELPFVDVERKAKFGLRDEDRRRLAELCKAQEETA